MVPTEKYFGVGNWMSRASTVGRVGAFEGEVAFLGGVDGTQIGEGFRGLGPFDRLEEAWDAEGGENADDDDHDREFHEGEPITAGSRT